jgi:spore coat polysaccharide biosynthesis protein SpsF
MKIGAVIQARTSSTRLPSKVLKELPFNSGITVLQQVVRRLKKSNKINEIIIATTTGDEDSEIVERADIERVRWFRGSRDDVLSRYYLTAKENKLDVIVRITSDCPCIDPEVVDLVVTEHIKANADYTSNQLIRTFPHGLDTEVLTFEALEKAYREAANDFEREHVCPYIYKTKADLFKIIVVEAPSGLHAPDIRITLDTEDDYALLCAVFDYLHHGNEMFKTKDIINLFQEKPWLKLINKKVMQKRICDTFEEEMEEAFKILDLQDLKRVKIILKERKSDIKHSI